MTVTADRRTTTPSAVIDRISLVLDAFDGPGRLTLAQIVRRTGLPRSSAHRMLERLVAAALAAPQRSRLRARACAWSSWARWPCTRIACIARPTPLLRELHRATGLVVHLAVLDGPDVVYLEKIGDRMVAAIPTRVGGRQPAHCTAVGKAILAYCDERRRSTCPARKTKYSIATPAQLAAELAKVRAHGVAFEREESLLGFGCVAAPIGDVGRGRRRGIGVRSDEPHDVRSAARRAGAHDRDGHLAQRRRRPAAGRADAATAAARCAARPARALQYA